MTICPSGKVVLTPTIAKALDGVRRRKRKGKKAYRCPICRNWHMSEAVGRTRTIVDSSILKWRKRRADRFLDQEDEE